MNSFLRLLILSTLLFSVFGLKTRSSRNSAGSCGNLPNVADSTCSCDIQDCSAGYLDCDLDPSDGCEINSQTDPLNCGVCFNDCSTANLSQVDTYTCSSGFCGIGSCESNFEDCNGVITDGCESNSLTDINNCGGCNSSCIAGPNVKTVSCSSGACSILSCDIHFRDCNSDFGDGCEVDIRSDEANCGGCSAPCSTPSNVIPKCDAGVCDYSHCKWETLNCDGIVGCETQVRTPFIYSEGLNFAKFQDNSLAGTVYDLDDTTPVFAGNFSLSYTPTPGDSIRFTCKGCLEIPSFSSGFTFEVNGGINGGQSINLILIKYHYGKIGVTVIDVVTFDIGSTTSFGSIKGGNVWQKGSITYSNSSYTKYDGIFIQNALSVTQDTVYFDNIQVSPASC